MCGREKGSSKEALFMELKYLQVLRRHQTVKSKRLLFDLLLYWLFN